jgi:hypothetical protein
MGHTACVTTPNATLPSNFFENPVLPLVPTTISFTSETISFTYVEVVVLLYLDLNTL